MPALGLDFRRNKLGVSTLSELLLFSDMLAKLLPQFILLSSASAILLIEVSMDGETYRSEQVSI